MAKYDALLKDKEFVEWFWSGQNGNNLIRHMNSEKSRLEIVRREKYSPHAYGIVLNVDLFSRYEQKLKFVKIGFTQQDTSSECGNRMEIVQKAIEDMKPEYKGKSSVLFVVMKNPVDTSSHSEFERDLRKKWGMPVSNDFAEGHNLAFHSEWVLTTQGHIDNMKNIIEKAQKEGRMDASIFKGFKYDDRQIPRELQIHRRN